MRWSIDWDEAKNRSNFLKHGFDFEDARLAFEGISFTFADSRFNYGELRLVTMGALEGREVIVTHSPRAESMRIISMRKANRREQQIYQKRLGKN